MSLGRLRAQENEYIRSHGIMIDGLWGTQCNAINIQVYPDQNALARLVEIQDRVESCGASFFRVPAHALHISVAALLGVRDNYSRPKDDIWTEEQAQYT